MDKYLIKYKIKDKDLQIIINAESKEQAQYLMYGQVEADKYSDIKVESITPTNTPNTSSVDFLKDMFGMT